MTMPITQVGPLRTFPVDIGGSADAKGSAALDAKGNVAPDKDLKSRLQEVADARQGGAAPDEGLLGQMATSFANLAKNQEAQKAQFLKGMAHPPKAATPAELIAFQMDAQAKWLDYTNQQTLIQSLAKKTGQTFNDIIKSQS